MKVERVEDLLVFTYRAGDDADAADREIAGFLRDGWAVNVSMPGVDGRPTVTKLKYPPRTPHEEVSRPAAM